MTKRYLTKPVMNSWVLHQSRTAYFQPFSFVGTIHLHCTLYPPCFSGSNGKDSACNAGDLGSIPGLGRSPGGRHGNPLQSSCLENPTDRGAWWAAVHSVPKSQTWLKRLGRHTCTASPTSELLKTTMFFSAPKPLLFPLPGGISYLSSRSQFKYHLLREAFLDLLTSSRQTLFPFNLFTKTYTCLL